MVQAGGDMHAKDENGKTPYDMAVELKAVNPYKLALADAGFTETGTSKVPFLNERNTKFAVFALPILFFYLIFTTLSLMPWYTGIPLAGAEFFGMHHVMVRVVLMKKTYTDNLPTTPYFAAIITASIFWVGFTWLTRLATNAEGYPFTHLVFVLCLLLCSYNFFRSVTLDAGTCPKPPSDSEAKAIIEELASSGRLNGMTFCVDCMARKPLRSKHCRVCQRCTAKFDHHCPWVWNCVGANNHRQFILFVTTLIVGIASFDSLSFAYFSQLPEYTPSSPSDASICDIYPILCKMTQTHEAAFVLAVLSWATLQLTWTFVLLGSQLFQISKQMTTFELSNLGRYGYMGGKGGASMSMQQGHQHKLQQAGVPPSQAGVSQNEDQPSMTGSVGGHSHSHSGHSHGSGGHSHSPSFSLNSGFCGCLLQLLGLDRFTRGKAVEGAARANRSSNPFDQGLVTNCVDFWTKGRELGVEYESLYEVPVEGFREAKLLRQQAAIAAGAGDGAANGEHELGSMKRSVSAASRFVPSFLANMRGSRNPYQALNTSESAV